MSRPKIVIKSKDTPQDPPPRTPVKKEPIPAPKTAPKSKQQPTPSQDEKIPYKPINKKKVIAWSAGGLFLVLLGAAAVYYFFFMKDSTIEKEELSTEAIVSEKSTNYEAEYEDFEKDILSKSTTIRSLLNEIGIAGADISEVDSKLKALNLGRLRKGDKFTVFYEEEPQMIILEPKTTPYHKYVINCSNLEVEKVAKNREIRVNEMAAIVEVNLGVTFINNNLNLKLISKLEEIFQYSLDFFEIDDGDRFKILYETEYLDGKPNEVLGITSAFIKEGNKSYFAFRRKEGNKVQYYNEYGESLKKSFLQSPIKYGGVISSGFGLRVHPKSGHTKMHLGTDYAAPEGTPIVAVADGVVTGRAFAGASGNFVKLKHDDQFETQYLHMQKFEPSVTMGTRVRQGDVIGYVGSTGSSTGPHVCFRFKKNGEQVNPANHNSGTSGRISPIEIEAYKTEISPLQTAIKKVEYF